VAGVSVSRCLVYGGVRMGKLNWHWIRQKSRLEALSLSDLMEAASVHVQIYIFIYGWTMESIKQLVKM
jgi:hypothetical protein